MKGGYHVQFLVVSLVFFSSFGCSQSVPVENNLVPTNVIKAAGDVIQRQEIHHEPKKSSSLGITALAAVVVSLVAGVIFTVWLVRHHLGKTYPLQSPLGSGDRSDAPRIRTDRVNTGDLEHHLN